MDGLSLVLDDGNGERHVSKWTHNLRFTRSATGGDRDLTCSLSIPRGWLTNPGPGTTVRVDDGRTGKPMWRGTLSQPGLTVGPRGESYELQAFGGGARLQAVTDSLAYVHELHQDFRRVDSTKGANVDEQEKNNGTPTLEVSWPKLFELEHGDQGEFACRTFQHAGLKIGRFKSDFDAGRDDTNLVVRLMTGTDVDTLTSAATDTAVLTDGFLEAHVGGAGITVGDDIVGLRVHYDGPTLDVEKDSGTNKIIGGVPDKTYWVRFLNVTVCQLRKDKHGDNITTGYATSTVTADQVIADMLGRGLCPGLDMSKVTVEPFTYAIDALSWLDGIKMGDALEHLRDFEPTLTWQVYGDEGYFGPWRGVRYVISKDDGGISMPGEEVSLADRVYVSWLDRRGRQRTTKVTDPSIPVKQEADPIDLGDVSGSEANAQWVGERALELHNNPPAAGSAVVRRPIEDLVTGAIVQPFEILPGYKVVERETGKVFRLAEVDYDHDARASVLTLGEPVRPIESVIARLERHQRRRRR